jgi:hypothetical protein
MGDLLRLAGHFRQTYLDYKSLGLVISTTNRRNNRTQYGYDLTTQCPRRD